MQTKTVKPRLVAADEIVAYGDWERRQETLRAERAAEVRAAPEPAITVVRHAKPAAQDSWTEQHARGYRTLIGGLARGGLGHEALQLAHLFRTEGAEFTSVTKDALVLSFNYPFRLLRDAELHSEYLRIFAAYLQNETGYLRVVLHVDRRKPTQSFLRLDPQGDVVSRLA